MQIGSVGSVLAGAVSYSGYSSSGGNDYNSVASKISSLKQQKEEYEEKLKQDANSNSEDMQNKIDSLNNRINNLQSRLDKLNSGECKTCENRKYQDGSDDPTVSFKSPTNVKPEAAAYAVKNHESEHVSRNQAKADAEDKEIVSQNVTIKTGICPECGKTFVSGGETETVTRSKQDNRYSVGLADYSQGVGQLLDTAA